jgi:hypothetical protein
MAHRRPLRRRGAISALLLCGALLGACGGDDASDGDTVAVGTAATPGATDPAAAPTEPSIGGCSEVLFDGTISRAADGGHRDASLTSADVVDAVAYRLGSNHTVYLSNRPIDRSVFEAYDRGEYSTENALTAPTDGVLATVFLYGDDGVSAGTTIDVASSVSGLIVDAGGGPSANTLGEQGTITVIDATEDRVCFTIDYRDDLQQMSGTVSVPVWPES